NTPRTRYFAVTQFGGVTYEPPVVELKDLPPHLEYEFLEGDDKLPIMIAKDLKDEEKIALIKVLKSHKQAIAWQLFDIKGIDPEFCTHKILIGDDFKPAVQHQIRVNPKIHEVIKKEVLKLLDSRLIYPISNIPWVSPVHCVPKKGGFTVVKNEENELIPTRLVPGIVLDHKILKNRIKVDKAKVDVIAKLPYPTTVKGIRSFPDHAGFYRRFIHDFSKIARPMARLLEKDTLFFFSKECIEAFQTLKKKLTKAPILVAPDWDLPLEIMCDVSDFAIGCALLRKKFKEDLFTSCVENGILQDSSELSMTIPTLLMLFKSHSLSIKTSCTYELCGNDAHYGYNCPSKVLIVPNLEPFNNQTIKELPQTLPCFNPTCYFKYGNSFTYDSISNLVHDSPNVFDPPLQPPFYSCEFCENDARYGHYCTPQVSFVNPEPCYNQDLNLPQDFHDFQQQDLCCENYEKSKLKKRKRLAACYDDDDDYTIAIAPKEPDNSLSIGDDHLDTILATELDEFIKSSVENLVPNPSESEGEYECDSFSGEDIPKKIYSNLLFDEEIISMKIDPHHFNAESDLIESLLNHDSYIISSSSNIDSLFDEFIGEITLLKSILSRINETDCDPEEETHFIKRLLYDNSSPRLPEEFVFENYDAAFESFSPFPIAVEDSDSFMKEIDLSFTLDYPMSSGIEEDNYDSERDILILEELFSNDSLSLHENGSFHFDIPSSSRPPAKPPNGNTEILNVKVMGDISKHKVHMPRLMFTQSTIVLNQEKSLNFLPHRGHKAYRPSTECPMMINGKNNPILDVPCFHFHPP
nr:hypothetical protein [Tanacetum cinerariifolium]